MPNHPLTLAHKAKLATALRRAWGIRRGEDIRPSRPPVCPITARPPRDVLEALIAMGWGDVPQPRIPREVVRRAEGMVQDA